VRAKKAMEPNATRFPFPLPPRTIGEQKAKVKSFSDRSSGSISVTQLTRHLEEVHAVSDIH